ncbi:hypothetical protein [Sutcliffiella deserti]|uniref:hypothetical protein n=1 Tax=Sutcliffiella deserti TaxID=2875501 RepID=UPI001CBE79F2|nr:hypothetical protein [Sutcliffiella deserti]
MKTKLAKILTTSFILVLFIVSGCTDVNTEHKDMESIAIELEKRPVNQFQSQSDNYNIQGKIFKSLLEDRDVINFEVILDEPKSELLDLTVTFVLNEDLIHYLHANFFFTSNLFSTSNLSPDGEEKGLGVSKSFSLLPDDHVLKYEKFDKETFKSLIEQIKVKTSWRDTNGNEHSEYILLEGKNISIDETIYTLFE